MIPCQKAQREPEVNISDSALKLENQLCFPLYAAAKGVLSRYKPLLDELGLTYTQYIAMMVMWENKRVSVNELGGRLFLDSGTLTPLLKRLEAKGFVRRERSHEDERAVIVSLTAEGEKLKEKALPVPEKMKKCLPLSNDESHALYRLLYKLLANDSCENRT